MRCAYCLLWCLLVAAMSAAQTPDGAIIGEWDWPEGILTVEPGGGFRHANGDGGSWRDLAGARTYQLVWDNGYIDRLVVSEDGEAITGNSNQGKTFTAHRRRAARSTVPAPVQGDGAQQQPPPPTAQRIGAGLREGPAPVQGQGAPQHHRHAASQSVPQAVVIVEGDAGVGSGFVTVLAGELVVVTNAHVIVGNRQIRLRSITGERIPFKDIRLGISKDLAVLPLYEWAGPVLAVQEGVARTVTIGTEIAAYGNSGGEGVVTQTVGQVSGIGPEKVEVTADIVGGNSGGPVVLAASGRVVAVATYVSMAEPTWVTSGTRFEEVRRFALRLDNLAATDLEVLDEAAYYADLERYSALRYRDRQAIAFLVAFAEQHRVRTASVEDGLLRELAVRLNRAMARAEEGRTTSSAQRLTECFDQLRDYLAAPLKSNPRRLRHGFIHRMYAEEAELNRTVLDAVDSVRRELRDF